MYLKSLTLKGFKSFADKTNMVFDKGLNVVVGPNGSGKSNVSDAVLWVLGEQSARQLRGAAMEDVIFSGSSARKPVGVAEVTLVLSNSDHTLPIDFDEVGITRRMYRSGESEYLINGAPARLMDIQDILHDSGLGKETHSIISQGKLDQVLSSRPEERRALIEEAAGIAKHRRRKERSEKKLKDMNAHVDRAKDINREILRQLRPLERQVDKAKRFSEMDARRSELKCILAVDDLRHLQDVWVESEKVKKEAEAAVEMAEYKRDEAKNKLEKQQGILEEKGIFVGDLGEQRRRVQDQLGRIESDMRLLEEKGKNMVGKLSETRMNLSSTQQKLTLAQGELSAYEKEQDDVSAQYNQLTEKVGELSESYANSTKVREDAESSLRELNDSLRAQQALRDDAQLAYSRLKEEISAYALEDAMVSNRISQIDEELSTNSEALDAKKKQFDKVNADLKEACDSLDNVRADIAKREKSVVELRDETDKLRHDLSTSSAKLDGLKTADEAASARNPRATKLMSEQSIKSAVFGKIADNISAPHELEGIIESLLGDALDAYVAKDDSSLLKFIDSASSLGDLDGSVGALSCETLKDEVIQKGVPGKAILEQIEVNSESASAIQSLLGNVRLVNSIKDAFEAHKKFPNFIFVSKDGTYVLQSGLIKVGHTKASTDGALERKRNIRELKDSVAEFTSKLEKAEGELETQNAELKTIREKSAEIEQNLSRLKGDAESCENEVGRLTSTIERLSAEKTSLKESRDKHSSELEDANKKLEEFRNKTSVAVKSIKDLTIKIDDANKDLDCLRNSERNLSTDLQEAKLSLAKAEGRKNSILHSSEELKNQIAQHKELIDASTRATRSLEVLRLRIDPLHMAYEKIREEIIRIAERLRDKAVLMEADSSSLKNSINDAKSKVDEAQSALDAAREALNVESIKMGKLEVQVKAAIDAVNACSGMPLEEALEIPAPKNREEAAKELDTLEGKIENLGPVNQVAMEEYSRLKERSDYIAEQLQDLESAKDSLTKIMRAIDKKMRHAFIDTFDAVNKNFEEVFALFFPGGHAHLELLDEEHPDTTGIEIVAQPRGKKIPKLALMSGGEKSLTALALLFAIYKTHTVPFYIFDEVEAALDDSNLGKLIGAIEQLKATTQLIVITHQRRTMEEADVLYGVSMQADGVSHVVSQRLDKASGRMVDVA